MDRRSLLVSLLAGGLSAAAVTTATAQTKEPDAWIFIHRHVHPVEKPLWFVTAQILTKDEVKRAVIVDMIGMGEPPEDMPKMTLAMPLTISDVLVMDWLMLQKLIADTPPPKKQIDL